MAKRRKKKRIKAKWGRIVFALVVIFALLFGAYKGTIFMWNQAVSFIGTLFASEEKIDNPSKNDKEKSYVATVIIDPGHGGIDGGTTYGDNLLEKDIVLKTSFYIQEELEKQNVRAILTREEDVNLDSNKHKDLDLRAEMSETYDATFFVSIHINAFEGKEKIRGYEAYIENKDSRELAQSILDEIDQLEISKNRGIVEGENLRVIKNNTVPATLIEIGYIDSEQDRKYLTDDSELQRLGKAIADGIVNQLSQQ